MSIEAKIDRVVDIWIEQGSLSATPTAKNRKYNEILEKITATTYTEEDLDKFINRYSDTSKNKNL